MRLTFVQHAGDYKEAFERFARGGKSTYHAQQYSVEFVGSLANRLSQVTVLCAVCDEPYDLILPNGVRAVGAGLNQDFYRSELVPFLARTAPDRLCLTTPMIPLLRWARREHVRTMTVLADSFASSGPFRTLQNRLLARELNHTNVEWVGNHGVSACLSLLEIGVNPDKVIPWDWPRLHRPYDYPSRVMNRNGSFKLAYVGSVSEAKGVGDLLRALRLLENVSVTIIGPHNGDLTHLAHGLDVDFVGVIPNEDIPIAMRQSDAVVIPSRHEYPEGLPATIYQAFAARTPIIASDHPMFRGAVAHEKNALVFPAGDEITLASMVRRLAGEPDLYATLSASSLEAWEALQIPVKWGELIERWLSDQPTDDEWFCEHRLGSGLYADQIEARHAA